MELSLVLPCFNEEQNVASAVRGVAAWMHDRGIEGEIVAVNDGSVDGTARAVEQLQREVKVLRVVTHPSNRGYGAAVTSGCDAATKEYIGFMDCDGQFDPKDFDKLLPYLRQVDFVTGRRLRRADPWRRRVTAKVFGILVLLFLQVYVRDINCAMKVFRRDLWPRIHPQIATGGVFNAELFYRLRRNNVRWIQVPVAHYPRRAGAQTGGSPRVILRAMKELVLLRKQA